MSFLFNVADSTIGGIDEYTVLMMHMDGADNGTVFTDDSPTPHSVTRYNALTKTGTKQFGTAAGYFDGTGDYLSVPDSEDWAFGGGNFTIDCWVKLSSLPVENTSFNIVTKHDTAAGNREWSMYYEYAFEDSGRRMVFVYSTTGSNFIKFTTDTFDLSISIWTHISVVRDSNNTRIYIDGIQSGTTHVASYTIYNSNTVLRVGCDSKDGGTLRNFYNGYIDELRISKGIARWTENFTPETGPYTE